MENTFFKGFTQIDWDVVKKGSTANFSVVNLTAVHGKNYKGLIGGSMMMIDFECDVASYTFTGNNELIIADNSANAIFFYDISLGLHEKKKIYFDLDIRKLTYSQIDK